MTAGVLVYADGAEPEVRKKEFATHKKALRNLRLGLHTQKVTHVAMESAGVYWKPRHAAKQGVRKAIVSVAHRILVIAFCLLRDRAACRDAGADYYDRLNPLRARNRPIRRLQRLGADVTLAPMSDFPPCPCRHLRASKEAGPVNALKG